MKIAVDAMGGDNAPGVVVKGVVDALREKGAGISVVFTGPQKIIESEIEKNNAGSLPVEIVHTDEVVGMDDSPSKVFKAKPNSSINIAVKLQAEGKVQASLSAGNTGALLASSMFIQGRMEGVLRPAVYAIAPSRKGPCVLLDVGANVDCKPQHLLQFSLMGTAYAQHMLDIDSPRVGLLSVGTENSKGNELTTGAFPLLEKNVSNFIGNMEGNAILDGVADVIVCDGFVGNVVLKMLESFAAMFKGDEKKESLFDYSKYGGVQFLGINGICIKAHGRSSARAIKNAIFVAEKSYKQNINRKIEENLRKIHNGFES